MIRFKSFAFEATLTLCFPSALRLKFRFATLAEGSRTLGAYITPQKKEEHKRNRSYAYDDSSCAYIKQYR